MTKCMFCGEEEAVKQIPNPNGDWDTSARVWNVCWECGEYVKWAFLHSVYSRIGKELKPFDEWLFEKHKVYPKIEWMACVLKKKST